MTYRGLRALVRGAKPYQRKLGTKESFGRYTYNGIDRIDNALGYVIGNVTSCCGTCNKAKATMGRIDFLDWVRRVYRWSCED